MKLRTATSRGFVSGILRGCLFALLLAPVAVAQPKPTIVRGKIERQTSSKKYPAPRVRLTIAPVNDKNRTTTAFTGSDGMYYFYNVATGEYILSILNSNNQLIRSYTIVAEKKTYTDIKPIVIP